MQVEAKKAVPRDDQNVLSRSNSSSHGSPGPTPIRTKKIFVGGLASTVTESDFKNYFDQFGTITDVVVMYDHNTHRPRGFGFITYDSEEAVEKVLYKNFHELNGKLVEVKRAVPKELSPGPGRGQLGGFSYGTSRVGSFANGCIQGYNPSLIGGHGLRIDGRLSPVTVGRSGYPLFSPSYGTGLNFDPPLSQNENANFTSNFVMGRALNSSYSGSPSRFNNTMGYTGSSFGNSSTLSSTNQNLWGNGNLNYANSASSDAFIGYGSENSSMGSFGNIGSLWSTSLGTNQAGTIGSGYGKGSLNYRSGDVILGSKAVGYGKNSESVVESATPYALTNSGYDDAFKDTYEAGPFYQDHQSWRSSTSALEDSGSLSFGLENAVSDLMRRNSSGHIGAYAVANRQSNRGRFVSLL